MMIWIDCDQIRRLFWRQLANVNCAVILSQRSHLLAIYDIAQIRVLNVLCSDLVHGDLNVKLLNLKHTADLDALRHFLEALVM